MDLQTHDRSGTHNDPACRGQIRRRAIIACRHCSMRKVRCDVATSGLPCGNCMRDNILCEVIPRRKRRYAMCRAPLRTLGERKLTWKYNRGRQRVVNSSVALGPSTQETSRSVHGSPYAASIAQNVNHPLRGLPETYTATSRSSLPNETSNPEIRALNAETLSDEGENKDAYVQALDASPRSPEEELSSLFYCGKI